MRVFATARSMPGAVQLLLVNQLGVTFGFYLLVPYLAVHLREDLALSTAAVGAVIGIRSLFQQGLMVVGGVLADRFGCRPVILVGCAVRAVGFGLFAFVDSLAGLLFAAVLTGLGGAVFSTAIRAYLAMEAGEQRLTAFALFNMASTTGALTGPLVGSALILVDFRWVALGAAAVFVLLTVAQALGLPDREPDVAGASMRASARVVATDRRFLAFSIACAGLFTLYSQLYLLLPLEASRRAGTPSATAVVFGVATVLTLLWQLRLTRAAARSWPPGRAISTGLALMGLSFLPLLVFASAPDGDAQFGPGLMVALLPIVATTAIFTLGYDLAQPFAIDLAAGFAPAGLTGTYLGMFYLASGIGAAVGNVAIGLVADLAEDVSLPWLTWLVVIGIGLASAGAVLTLQRGQRLFPSRRPAGTTGSGGLELRAATASDCGVLTAMVRTSGAYEGAYRVMVAGQSIDPMYVEQNVVRVAERAGRVVGFWSLLRPGRAGADEAELDFMFVADEAQGSGIGRLMFHDLRREATALAVARVLVVAHPPATEFYLRMGASVLEQLAPAGCVTWSRPLLAVDTSGDGSGRAAGTAMPGRPVEPDQLPGVTR